MNFSGLGIDDNFLNNGAALNLGGLDGVQDMLREVPAEYRENTTALFESEMQNMGGPVDFKLWTKIISLQKEFNDRVAPGWEQDLNQTKHNYWTAILDETMEVIGSKHWKWWKDTDKLNTVDWDNVNVELIDIFHFILSVGLQLKQHDIIFMTMIAEEKNKKEGKLVLRDKKFFDGFWNEFLMAVWQKSLPLAIVKWCEYFYKSGGDFQSLARDYFIKNSLNHIRQEFGYADGRYQKMWRHPTDPSKKVEDNVVAVFLLGSRFEEVDEGSFEEMIPILRKYYLEFVSV